MKLFSIFCKNLKSISRNSSYFVILVICPILLILVAGLVLNSVSFGNVSIGMVGDSELDVSGIANLYQYDNLSVCLSDLRSSKITACIESRDVEDGQYLEIYLDNSEGLIASYMRQFILKNLLDM